MGNLSRMLWVLAMCGVLAISQAVWSHRLGTDVVSGNRGLSSEPRWRHPVPDLHSIDLDPVLGILLERVDGDVRLVLALLDAERVAAIQADCPPKRPELLRLCEPERFRQLARKLAHVMRDALGDPDDDVALWAVELLVFRKRWGAAIAEEALLAQDAAYQLERQQTLAIHVLAWTLPRPEAVVALRKGLEMPGPVAAMAALELARLQATGAEADLTRAEARLENTVPGLLVSHAHGLLDQGQSSP
jgi:hypothetical protein